MSSNADRPTIVVFGSINMDLVCSASRMPAPGETILGTEFRTTPGGKGANQAVAAARLGATVRMVGRVGADSFGPTLIAGLQSNGVDVAGIQTDSDNSSGIATILLDAAKQNYIVAVYGANMACDDMQLDALDVALVGADALLLQLETPLPVTLAAANRARPMGALVIWDPAPARDLPSEVFKASDVMTPNQIEAELLTSVRVTDAASAEAAADELLKRGVGTAVVKLGEAGAYYASESARGLVQPFEVEAVDTIAAGDAFGGALGVALARGQSVEDAIRYGCAAGALAVTKSGAQEAMPIHDEVAELLTVGA
ncbi:MAG: ribokinase [SAR202 cluster bacterium]|mgnify:FL=1|nr:ribokinase [SAR202 cluster bacterium]MDP7104365.1 ribokinase [SAR202 cluster bacterium]MDP7225936.1 ribokinase [SAR202 cluster bacterium]MDP7413061.1 ribokinase [SAR202 cluster bacterium]HJO81982.1 ribokinase [SAR202 cluster bacterium]